MLRGGVSGQAGGDANSFSLSQSVNNEHADILLASVQSLRTDNLAFDFFIHVNDTVFPVHKLVLISFSDYFRAMLLNDNFEETKQGKVEMINVEVFAMKEAVEYMYTGNCSVTMENLGAVLSCADMLQLDRVKEICFKYMLSTLSVENCVFFLQMAAIHSNKSVVDQIGKYFRFNFFAIGSSDDFLELELTDVSKYIHEYGLKDIEAWKVGLAWVKRDITIREGHVFEIVQLLRLVDYPSYELLKCMWEEPIFKQCPECMDFIHHRLFIDVDDLEQNINMDNCIFLIHQSRHYKHDNAVIRKSIIEFMKTNLGQLMALSDFSNLHKDDVKVLILADDTNYLSETTKWSAIHKWIEVNSSDTDIFSQLFQSIDYNHIPIRFINDNIIDNSIIKELSCYKDVLHGLCERRMPSADLIAVLWSGAKSNLLVMNMLTEKLMVIRLPQGLDVQHRALISVNGKLCLITGHTMYFLNRGNSWMRLKDNPDFEIPMTAVLVELADCIYILNKDTTYVYTPISNEWSSECGCGFDAFTATSSNNYLYVLSQGTGIIKRFNPASCKWTEFSGVDEKDLSYILFVDGKLYVTNGSRWVQYSTISEEWIFKRDFGCPHNFKNLIAIGDKALVLLNYFSTLLVHTLDISCGMSSEKSFSASDMRNDEIIAACTFRKSGSNQVLQHSKRMKLI